MKSVRYFTLNFSGFTTAACEKQGYLRLIAGDHVFYTDKRYFNDPSLFDRLTINQPLHLASAAWTTAVTGSTGSAMAKRSLSQSTGKALGPAAADYQPADAHRRSYPAHDEHLRMGKVRLRHYRDNGLHRVVNRPLRATVPPGAKNAPRHARSVGEDGAGPPPRLFLLPAATDYGANPPPVGEAFYASPAGTLCRPDGKN